MEVIDNARESRKLNGLRKHTRGGEPRSSFPLRLMIVPSGPAVRRQRSEGHLVVAWPPEIALLIAG